jgi:methyl-accepting chemotaxis protein
MQEIMMPIPQVTDRLKEVPAMLLRTVFAGIGQLLMAADKVRAQLQEQLVPQPPDRPPAGQADAGRQQPEATGTVTLLSDRQGVGGQRAHTRPASPVAPATGPAASGTAAPRPAPPVAAAAKSAASTARPTARPAAAKPAATESPTAKPTPAKRTATKRTSAKPADAKPAAAKPAAAKPAAAKPAAAKPARAKPAAAAAASPVPVPPIADYDNLSVASLRARLRGLDPDGVRALLDYERATAHRDDVITMYEHRLARLAGETG